MRNLRAGVGEGQERVHWSASNPSSERNGASTSRTCDNPTILVHIATTTAGSVWRSKLAGGEGAASWRLAT
eukprot:1471788-Pyramimonas_sp.AAC.1